LYNGEEGGAIGRLVVLFAKCFSGWMESIVLVVARRWVVLVVVVVVVVVSNFPLENPPKVAIASGKHAGGRHSGIVVVIISQGCLPAKKGIQDNSTNGQSSAKEIHNQCTCWPIVIGAMAKDEFIQKMARKNGGLQVPYSSRNKDTGILVAISIGIIEDM
jgi:hypothetical protein